MLTCTWWTCSIEKSLLKQALNIGMDEGWNNRLPLPGGEPPPCRALSRESSVPFEAWFTESRKTRNFYSTLQRDAESNRQQDNYWCEIDLFTIVFGYLWRSLKWGPAEWSQPEELPSFWASAQPAAPGRPPVEHPVLWNGQATGQGSPSVSA